MQNKTSFDTHLQQQLQNPVFKYYCEKELQEQMNESIRSREESEKVVVELVNRVGLNAFFLGLSDVFYGDEIEGGGRRLRRELDDKLSNVVDLVQGG